MTMNASMTAVFGAAAGDGSVLRWLLGLDRVDPGDGSVIFEWGTPLPFWLWLLIAVGVLAVAGQSYRRLLGRKSARVLLAATRGGLLLLLVALLAGPNLVLPRERVEEDHVLMLLDRSRSMTVADVRSTGVTAATTRDRQLARLLDENGEAWRRLAEDHRVQWLGFSDHLAPLGGPEAMPEASGDLSALRTALMDATNRAAGKPIGGIVVFSDGRSSQPMDQTLLSYLTRMGVEVWSVPLGAAEAPLDLSIGRIDGPDRAFVNDTVPVTVRVGRNGESGVGDTPPPGTSVRMVDELTGEVLDEQPVERFDEQIRLLHTPRAAGRSTWRIELTTPQRDLVEANNRATLELELIDRPIRVLYVEGYPRWEYRYLKTLLVREPSVLCSIMLVSADRDFAQEGTLPLQRLPRTEEEIADYDVIIIGDVPAPFFSSQQQRLLDEQVSRRGAGLMWIGGPNDSPGSYVGSSLAAMLPMIDTGVLLRIPPPIDMEPTPVARALGVLRLLDPNGAPPAAADPGWPDDLPALRWAQAVDEMKPATEVLAAESRTGYPLVMRMRYGAGQTMYVATDETWRWRYGRGELYRQQFWMQLVRLLARGRLQQGAGEGFRAALTVSHRRVTMGQPVVVELVLHDQRLLDAAQGLSRVEVEVRPAGDNRGAARAAAGVQRILLTPSDGAGRFTGRWTPSGSGTLELTVTEATLTELGLLETITVVRDDAEMRYPAADHALLAELSEATGGGVIAPDDVGGLPELVANRASHATADIREPLTHSPLAFICLLVLLTCEWIGRRVIGLA